MKAISHPFSNVMKKLKDSIFLDPTIGFIAATTVCQVNLGPFVNSDKDTQKHSVSLLHCAQLLQLLKARIFSGIHQKL